MEAAVAVAAAATIPTPPLGVKVPVDMAAAAARVNPRVVRVPPRTACGKRRNVWSASVASVMRRKATRSTLHKDTIATYFFNPVLNQMHIQ